MGKKLDSNLSHVDEGFEVVAELNILFNVVVCGVLMIGTMLSNFVLNRILHVHILVVMGKDAILNRIQVDFPHCFLERCE